MRIQICSAALAALTLVAPACTENGPIGPRVPLAPSFNHATGFPSVRISEIHYDNAGTDAGEFIEISAPEATDLTGWRVILYNGSNGAAYGTTPLTGLAAKTCGERKVVTVNYPSNGIQNGDPDGIALVDPTNHVVEFLSYEGTFTATGTLSSTNPAAGLVSTDIRVSEGSSTPVGHSVWRLGEDPTIWEGPALNPDGAGKCNDTNVTPPPPPPVVVPDTRFTEIHYDNIGLDGNEKIEIGGPAGTDLTGWSIVLYSGNSSYNTTLLSGAIPASCEGRGVIVVSYPQDGIQNGPRDGFALLNATGEVIEFLSYEGTMTPTGGPAAGMTSTDIGVSESPTSPIGYSLQRNPNGDGWQAGAPATFGLCNGSTPPPLSGVVTFTGRSAFDDPPLPVGFEDQLFATQRDPSNVTVTTEFAWTSETPAIASVDEDGVVRALAPGTAILRATGADGTTGTHALPTRIATPSTTAVYDGNAEFGEPMDGDASDDFIVRRPQLISSYSEKRGTPNWVAYELEDSHFGSERRCDCFTFDPLLPATYTSYTTADYTGAGAFHGYGIDRGHLARSADRDAGSLDNAVTYYFTNIIPQAADNNQGPWSKLETHLGNLADFQNKEVYIIAGVAGNLGTVKNEGKITIPGHVWKVAVIMPRDHGLEHVDDLSDLEIVAVIMPNIAGIAGDDWEKYRATVNEVEALSGYDLLALLSDEIEIAVESGLQQGILQLRQLITDGTISYGTGSSLNAKLDAAVKQLDRWKVTPAVNQLEAFLRELDALKRTGRLDAAEVEALRAVVVEVIRTLSS
ncbi:MAG TPA: DNA/RNA non-specific endonuclease [Gemmatimonadaceae bacterium]|nr:DNA/RNA non-specific endonuclease [Gemmatimonadaceae bacterium]